MNRFWRQLAIATNWPILVAVLVLSSMGLISIFVHGEAESNSSGDARKQLMFIVLGFACMFLMQTVSYIRLGRYAWPMYLVSILLLIYILTPGVPSTGLLGVPLVNGAKRWINFGFLSLQPSEMAKVGVYLVLARYLRFRSNYRTLSGLLPPFAIMLIPQILILKQPDLGTSLIFIPALFSMLFVAGAKKRHLLAIMALGLILVPVAWYAGPKKDTGLAFDLPVLRHLPTLVRQYQRGRVYALFSSDPAIRRDFGFQQEHAIIAFGAGGLGGRGIGNIPAGLRVPEAHNDMIFSLIGEQFGFIGAAVLLGAYLVLFTAGVEIASATREPFGRLIAVGTVSMLAGQAFLNLMVPMRLAPVTGITLPFVSYGGSSVLASFIAAGLLLNIGQNRPLVMANDSFEFD